MLSMNFLTQRQHDGLEFINFQNSNFSIKMTSFLEEHISSAGVLSKNSVKGIKEIIEEFTGFQNIHIELVEEDNFGVDVGYFSPNNVINNPLAEELMKPTETTLYRWFVSNKDKVFKGHVDYKTGKVHGGFKTVPIKFMINVNLNHTFPNDIIQKYGASLAETTAGAFAHEMGHCYGACALMSTMAADNVIARAALTYYRSRSTPEQRVVVLQDMSALLEVKSDKIGELQDLAQNDSDGTIIMYFNKLINQRNTSRALSLGVERMSSEVIADVYAIRMGCSKGILAAIGALVDRGCIGTFMNAMLAGVVYTAFSAVIFFPQLLSLLILGMPFAVLATGALLIFMISTVTAYFLPGFSGDYNADHRRFEDALRQLVQKLKEVAMPKREKDELLKDIEQMFEISKNLRPWYEGTLFRRTLGWIFNGADFKKQEHEHFTQAIANSEINVLSERFKTLA